MAIEIARADKGNAFDAVVNEKDYFFSAGDGSGRFAEETTRSGVPSPYRCTYLSGKRVVLDQLLAGQTEKPSPDRAKTNPEAVSAKPRTSAQPLARLLHIFDTNTAAGGIVSYTFSQGLTTAEEDEFLIYVLNFQGQHERLPSEEEVERYYASAVLRAREGAAIADAGVADATVNVPDFDWQRFEEALEKEQRTPRAARALSEKLP